VRELLHAVWVELSSRYRVACYQVGHMDFALAIRGARVGRFSISMIATRPPVTLTRLARKMGHVDFCSTSSR
jgi:hypothetical protein